MIKIRIKNADHEIDVRFPISENELYAKLAEIHAIEEKDAPQSAFVTEVYWPEEFSMLKDRFANLDELNYLAKRMESFDYHEYDQFLIGITKLQNPTEKDLINLTFNLDHFTLCKDVSSYGKIGREYVMNTQGAVPANDEDDPKYAAIGKELIDKGLAQITGKGLLIYNPFDELTEVYDGQTFPEYYYENTLASAEVSYNGRTELLLLPGEELAIQKALARLGAPSDSDCEIKFCLKQLRVAAYCRVSTKQEDQLNSYDVQRRAYTDKINGEPGWTMVGIYADKGITGTSVKKRDDFNRLMRHCKQGKVDMIITKSVARFARNTLDCLKHTRMLKEHNVDVYFEEQGIHSIQPGAEFYITIYGSIAQSESENISANVRWGKAQSAKEGNVPFHYKRFLGYRRGSDGKPEIDPEQAVVVKRIYERFLAGDSLATIANDLNTDGIPTPSGVGKWQRGTIESILTNEKYKGDAILNKTYIRDCLSKKVMINNGERPKYYVENNHPAIIDSATFGRVQEEMARRCGKRKVKQVGTKTEQGRYSSKYALTELLICGECGTPYRRCTWAANGKKKVVWRCINRLDYGKKYCHYSPSIEESVLQEAIMKAVMQTAKQNAEVLKTLKLHIGMGLSAGTTEDNSLDLQIRIAEIEAEFQKMLKAIAADNVEAFDEEKAKALMDEKAKLQIQLDRIADTKQKRENAKSRLDEIFTIIEALANHPISYDDQIVRQILESVIVESKEKIKVVFVGGLEVTQTI